jgi:hypothetical protein
MNYSEEIEQESSTISFNDSKKLCVTIDGEFIPVEKHISNILIGLLGAEANLLDSDILFFLPALNQSIAFIVGIESAINQQNFLCAAVVARGLIDTTMSLYFALNVDSTDRCAFIKRFGEKGDLTVPKKNGSRRRMTGKELVEKFKETGFDGSQAYENLSKLLHFTRLAMDAAITDAVEEKGSYCVGLRVAYGGKTQYPDKLWDEINGIVGVCVSVLITIIENRAAFEKSSLQTEGSK